MYLIQVLDGYYKSSAGYKIGLCGLPDTTKDDGVQVFGKLYLNGTEVTTNVPPKSHASSSTTYGVGTTSNYGHCRVINNLTTSSATNGYALQAYQGKVLKDLIDTLTPVVLYDKQGATSGLKSRDTFTITNVSTYKRLEVIIAPYVPNYDNTGGWNNVMWVDLTRTMTRNSDSHKLCRAGYCCPYANSELGNTSIQVYDPFYVFVQIDINNGTFMPLFWYGGTVKTENIYTVTKITGYKY